METGLEVNAENELMFISLEYNARKYRNIDVYSKSFEILAKFKYFEIYKELILCS
jgi:hypothetical protein